MTDTDRPSRPTPLSVFRSLTLAQSIVIVAIIAGGVALATLLPDGRFHDLAQLLVALVTGGGALGTAFLERKKDATDDAPPAPPPPTGPRRVPRSDGFALIDVLLWIVLIACMVTAGSLAAGCGAGAMQAHVRGARIAIEVLDSARAVSNATQDELQGACVDEACVLEVDARFVPVSVALDSAHAAWVLWVSAIEIGHLGGTTDGLLVAAVSAASRLLAEYSNLLRALASVGIEGPRMPEIVGLDGSAR